MPAAYRSSWVTHAKFRYETTQLLTVTNEELITSSRRVYTPANPPPALPSLNEVPTTAASLPSKSRMKENSVKKLKPDAMKPSPCR